MGDVIVIGVLVVLVFFGLCSSMKHFRGKGGCCGGDECKVEKKKLSKVLYKKTFRVEGMHCEHCKRRVEEAVNDINGVAGKVNLRKAELTVFYETDVTDDVIKNSLERLGYGVKNA